MNDQECAFEYLRCSEDQPMKVALTPVGLVEGKVVSVTIPELAGVSSLVAAINAITAAYCSGVHPEYPQRAALALAAGMAGDPHAMCPVGKMLHYASVLISGGTVKWDGDRLVIIDSEGGIAGEET